MIHDIRILRNITVLLLASCAGVLYSCDGAPESRPGGVAEEEADLPLTRQKSMGGVVTIASEPGFGGERGIAGEGGEEGVSDEGFSDLSPIGGVEYVIAISVDGLGGFYLDESTLQGLPAFRRLQNEGAFTLNARADTTYTYTLPNHSSMLTGLPVSITPGLEPEQAHGYTSNVVPAGEATLHTVGNPNRSYIPSVFDVVHDQGLKTAMYATKSKFVIFEQSYNAAGANDVTREDNGRMKIDTVVIELDHELVIDSFVKELSQAPPHFTFLHLAATDLAGHSMGWGGEDYVQALTFIDGLLGRVLDTIVAEPGLVGRTAVLLTSDHGGEGSGHSDQNNPINFTVPFYLWSPGFVEGGDLYQLLGSVRQEPPPEQNPPYTQNPPAIRNADMANVALELLGLPRLAGSVTTGFDL